MKNSLIVLLLSCVWNVKAQEVKPNMLIIPYAMNMYLSDIDDQLVSQSGYTTLQVKRQTRMGLEKSVYLAGAAMMDITTLANITDDSVTQFLDQVHHAIGYDYRLMPIEIASDEEAEQDKQSTGKKALNKIKGIAKKLKEDIAPEGNEGGTEAATIDEGQLVVQTSREERFMATKVLNPNLFEYLESFSPNTYYLFINQLDLKREMVINETSGKRERVLKTKMHYSMFNQQGELIKEGAVISYNKAKIDLKDDYYQIQFPYISYQMEEVFKNLLKNPLN